VPASSVKQHIGKRSAGTKQGSTGTVLLVPGFPDLAFNGTGNPAALRELALAYQVCQQGWQLSM